MPVFGEKDFVQINTSLFSRPLFDDLINEPAPVLLKEFIQELIYIFRSKNDFKLDLVRTQDNAYEITIENKNKIFDFGSNQYEWNRVFNKLINEIEYYETFFSIKVTARNDEKINFNYLAVIQMLSEYFIITSRNANKIHEITYENGELVNVYNYEVKQFASYIKFRFKFKDYLFEKDIPYKKPEISKQILNNLIRSLAFNNIGCHFLVFDEMHNDIYSYHFTSIEDYVDKCYGFDNAWTYCVNDDQDEHYVSCDTYYEWTTVSIALYPTTEKQNIEVYCNNRKLKYGTPFDAIKAALLDSKKDYSAVVKMRTRNPMWSDEARVGINNDLIYKKIYDETILTVDNMELWYKVLAYAKEKLNEVAYKLWIEHIRFKGFDEDRAVLQFSSKLNENMFLYNYSDLLEKAFENIIGTEVSFLVYTDCEFK